VIVHLKVTVFNLYEFLYAAEHTKNIYILKNVGNQTVDFSGSQWELFDCQNASNIFFVCSAAEGNSYRFRNKIWLIKIWQNFWVNYPFKYLMLSEIQSTDFFFPSKEDMSLDNVENCLREKSDFQQNKIQSSHCISCVQSILCLHKLGSWIQMSQATRSLPGWSSMSTSFTVEKRINFFSLFKCIAAHILMWCHHLECRRIT